MVAVVIAEDVVIALWKHNPRKLLDILNQCEVALEIERFATPEEGSSYRTYYGIVEMSKEEIISHVKRNKGAGILDIEDCIWYKYFEEKATLEQTQLILKEPQMPNKEQLVQAGTTFWENHGGKVKTFGLLMLGCIIGAGVKTAMDRKAEADQQSQPSA